MMAGTETPMPDMPKTTQMRTALLQKRGTEATIESSIFNIDLLALFLVFASRLSSVVHRKGRWV